MKIPWTNYGASQPMILEISAVGTPSLISSITGMQPCHISRFPSLGDGFISSAPWHDLAALAASE